MQRICKIEKREFRAVIKYFCKKGIPPKEMNEYIMETLRKESPIYNTMKKWAAEFKRGRESVEEYGWSGHSKDATADKIIKVVHTLIMCDRRRDLRSIASESDSTMDPNRHLRYVKCFGKISCVRFI